MKIKNLIKVVMLLILGSFIILIVSCTKTIINYSKLVNYKNLNTVSEHNGYVLAATSGETEVPAYAVYENVNYNNYQKVFDLDFIGDIWGGLVCWSDDRLFLFDKTITSYDLTTGKIVDKGDDRLLNGTSGTIDRVLGIADGFIYYEYTYWDHGHNIGYSKVSLDFKEVIPVDKKEIPKDLKK